MEGGHIPEARFRRPFHVLYFYRHAIARFDALDEDRAGDRIGPADSGQNLVQGFVNHLRSGDGSAVGILGLHPKRLAERHLYGRLNRSIEIKVGVVSAQSREGRFNGGHSGPLR